MPEESVDTRCPACSKPVFDGCNVVRCSRCEGLHHEPCWARKKACAARAACRGKPMPVIVVRLPARLDAAELSAMAGKAAADHVAETALPRVESRVETRASTEDLAAAQMALTERVSALERALTDVVRAENEKLRQDIERLRTQVDSATATVRALTAPGASLASTLTDALGERMEQRLAALEQRTDDVAAETRAGVAAAAQLLHQKLEEAHFALDRVRRPFPWDSALEARTGTGTETEFETERSPA